MRVQLTRLAVALVVGILAATMLYAAPLWIVLDPAQPFVVFDNNGVTSFTAADGHFGVTSEAINFIDPGGDSGPFVPFGTLAIDLDLDSSCGLIDGELVLTGTVFLALSGVVDGTPPNPPLLTADAVAFGFNGSGASTDEYDAEFQVTGGLLAGFWPGERIGVQITSEASDFADDCSVDFSGEAKGNLGGLIGATTTTTSTTNTSSTTTLPCRGKVTLCHKGKKTISVSVIVVPAHQAHGDTLGACP